MEISSYDITGNANLTAQQNNVSLTVFNFTESVAICVDCLAVNKRALVQLHFSFLLCWNACSSISCPLNNLQCIRVRPMPLSHVVSFFHDTGPWQLLDWLTEVELSLLTQHTPVLSFWIRWVRRFIPQRMKDNLKCCWNSCSCSAFLFICKAYSWLATARSKDIVPGCS